MKTYVIPSQRVTLKEKPEPLHTFMGKTRAVGSQGHDQKNYKSASELALEARLKHKQALIGAAEQRINKLEQNIAEAKAEHEALLREQTTELKTTAETQKQLLAKNLQAAEETTKNMLAKAAAEAKDITATANTESQKIVSETKTQRSHLEKQAETTGHEKGFAAGLQQAGGEVKQLQTLLKKTLTEIIGERARIIERSEVHIIELCMLLTRKVVKLISEQDHQLILRNIREALRYASGMVSIKLRVNTLDLQLAEVNKQSFYALSKSIKHITIVEDPLIEPGGCFIESDVGAIDARISTQLQELTLALREVAPIKLNP